MTRIELTFSDTEFGCAEYGYIARRSNDEPEDEDLRYENHVRDQLPHASRLRVRVYDARLTIEPRANPLLQA